MPTEKCQFISRISSKNPPPVSELSLVKTAARAGPGVVVAMVQINTWEPPGPDSGSCQSRGRGRVSRDHNTQLSLSLSLSLCTPGQG